MNFDISVDELNSHIDSRNAWPDILEKLGGLHKPVQTLGRGKHHDCPFPMRHNKSKGKNKFRLKAAKDSVFYGGAICSCGFWGNGYDLLMDLNGWSFPEALDAINNYLGDPCLAQDKKKLRENPNDIERKKALRVKAEAERIKRNEEAIIRIEKNKKETARKDEFFVNLLSKTWSEGVSVLDPLARPLWSYLENRGISPNVLTICQEQRFHPSCQYYSDEGELLGEYPCVLSLFRDAASKPITIHRIYLTPEGVKLSLKDEESAKKLMPYPSFVDPFGGAIQMVKPNDKLRIHGVGEGIETCWAATSATGIPTWPCFSDWYLGNFDFSILHKDIDLLLVWVDKDLSLAGEKAAKKLKKRCWDAGLACQTMLPPMPIPENAKSIDWNDVLRYHGREAFPKPNLDLILQSKTIQTDQTA